MRDARSREFVYISAMKVGSGKVARSDNSPAKTNSGWAGVLKVEVLPRRDPSQPQELLASFVRAGTSSRGFCAGVLAPNLDRSPRWDVVMRKKHAARLEVPVQKWIIRNRDLTVSIARIICHPSTSQGKALGMWCESLDLPLPSRGSPTCSPALAR